MDSGEPARSPPRREFGPDVRPGLVLEDKQDRDALVQLLRRPALCTVVRDSSSCPRPPSSAASAAEDEAKAPADLPWEGQGGVDEESFTGSAGSDLSSTLEGTGTNEISVDCRLHHLH